MKKKEELKEYMRKIIAFFRRHWWFVTHREYYCTLTPEEFKKLWNKNLDVMKID